MSFLSEFENTNIVTHKRFQGKNGIDERQNILEEIEYLSQHPDILEVLSHQISQIRALFDLQITELEEKEKKEMCSVTPLNRRHPNVRMIDINDPGFLDLIDTALEFPKYREKLVSGHLALMKVLNIKQA